MKAILNEKQMRLLRDIVSSRSPELLYHLNSADVGKLRRESRQLILRVLGLEFAASGVGADSEPTARGLEIEELLDIVNRPNLVDDP